jgi:UDP-N-acetylmuramoyl-tripeptide--D-alanyl-D-alanine ligase
MEPMMSLREAAAAIGARVRSDDTRFDSVSTDTRTLARGALFVALRGERFDGHRFLDAAKERGAAAAMVGEDAESESEVTGVPLLVVEDTRRGLGRLAAHWRGRFDIPLVAVTGSNGKTTVKEMIAEILRAHFGEARALATEANFNNDIGVPLTLLRLRESHRAAVVELGINHPGETSTLAALANPTVALVNNAQREHQEFLNSVAEVAREHGAVFASLRRNGVGVINADDSFAGFWRGLLAGKRIRDFGIEQPAQVSGRHDFTHFGSEIELRAPEGVTRIELHADGRHNVLNACAAAACALAVGAGLEAVARGLAAFRPVGGRMQRRRSRSGATLIDDSYNANPDSVRAAIDVLAAARGAKLLLLGDMGELGERGEEFHREIGRYARECGVDRLYATGALCRAAVEAFGKGARYFDAVEEMIAAVQKELGPPTTALVKGSRFMRMERVVQALAGEPSQAGGH